MSETNPAVIESILIISSHCLHCPAVLNNLSTLVKSGEIAQLTVINIEQQPLAAKQYDVRSVPWIKIGSQILQGAQTLESLRQKLAWAKQEQTLAADFDFLLSDGQAAKVVEQIRDDNNAMDVILELLGDSGTVLSTRIGIGVVMEEFMATDLLKSTIPALEKLSTHEDALIRSDACHYLGLSQDASVISILQKRLDDENADVREIAQDSIDDIQARS